MRASPRILFWIGIPFFSGCQMYDDATIQRFYGGTTAAPSAVTVSNPGKGDASGGKGQGKGQGEGQGKGQGKAKGDGRSDGKEAGKPLPIVPGSHGGPDEAKQAGNLPPPPAHPGHPPNPPHPPAQGGGPGDDPYAPGPDDGSRVVGETCVPASGSGRSETHGGAPLCLGLKYVVYQEPGGDPLESDRDAIDNVREVNQLWRNCGIQFQIDRYLPVDPGRENLRFRTAHYSELNPIRERFMDSRTLLVVMTGEWDRRGTLGSSWANAWTNLPGEHVFGSILESQVSRNPGVLAHELGHYLSLGHVEDARALMNPVIYPGSTALSPSQCSAARWAAGYFWKQMIRNDSWAPSEPAQPGLETP